MATSGSYNFSVTRDDIIEQAYGEIGLFDPESQDALDSSLVTDAAMKLNLLVKPWAKKYNLHLMQDVVLFLVLASQSYALGDATGDANWCAWDDYAQTTLSAAAAASAAAVSLTSAAGFTTGDKIGIVLDSGAIQWTTATMAGTTATLGTVLSGAAASGNVVFGYTSRIVRPLKIVRGSMFRRDITNSDTPVELVGKLEYDAMTAKTQSGKTIKAAYQPLLTSGRLWTWPCADLSTDVLRFTIERPFQDFDTTTDNPDFPVEASLALVLNLAVLLAGPNGAKDELPGPTGLVVRAQQALDDWLDGDVESAPVKFQPEIR